MKKVTEERSIEFKKFQSFEEWQKELHKDDTWLDTFMLATWWPFYRFCADFKWKYIKGIKRFIQRGYRGYADSDTWSLDSYLSGVIVGSLEHFRKNMHGWPDQCFKTEDEWKTAVDKMIYTFKLEKEAIDDNLIIPRNLKEFLKMKEIFKGEKTIKILTASEHKKYMEGWKLFQKYFRGLWD